MKSAARPDKQRAFDSSDLIRTSISLERELFDQLEALVAQSDYSNRSEFLRDLIRARLVQKGWDANCQVVGTITLVYDHHKRQLADRLTHLQHHFHEVVQATVHIHLDASLCAEAILVKGRAKEIQELANLLQREKGVLHSELGIAAAPA
jgi:CopG family nickel-responsive transcriptional regulator